MIESNRGHVRPYRLGRCGCVLGGTRGGTSACSSISWEQSPEVRHVRVEMSDCIRFGTDEVVEPVRRSGVNQAVANPFGSLDAVGLSVLL